MNADIYALRSIQLELLSQVAVLWTATPVAKPLTWWVSLRDPLYAMGSQLNGLGLDTRKSDLYYLPLVKIWKTRNFIAKQTDLRISECNGTSTGREWIQQILRPLRFKVDDSIWFGLIGDDRWDKALDHVHSICTSLVRGISGRVTGLISFKNIMVRTFHYAPSFVLDEDEPKLLKQWENCSADIQRTINRKQVAIIALRFLKMYCDRHMSVGTDQRNCDIVKAMLSTGLEMDKHLVMRYVDWTRYGVMRDMDGTPNEQSSTGRQQLSLLQPRGHPLYSLLDDLFL